MDSFGVGDAIQAVLARMPRAMSRTASALAGVIRARTLRGEMRSGNPPYSARHRRTRSRLGLQTGTPDLSMSGDMLGALGVISAGGGTASLDSSGTGSQVRGVGGRWVAEVQDDVTIGFPAGKQRQKAASHNRGMGRMPRREFMYVTQEELDAVAQEFIQPALEGAHNPAPRYINVNLEV